MRAEGPFVLHSTAARKALAADLVPHALRRHQLHLRIGFAAQPLETACQRFVVGGTRCQLELATAVEIAIDGFVAHDAFDGVHRVVIGAIPSRSLAGTHLGSDSGVVHGQAVVHMAPVAAGSLRGNGTGIQHHDTGTALRQRTCGRQAREATADDDHVRLGGQRVAAPFKRLGGLGPERFELHALP